MITARELALKILYDIQINKAYTNIELKKQLDKTEMSQVDKSFVTELVYGVIKWRLNIDWIIEQLSSVKLRKISPWIINILRLGIYQIKFLEKVPASAAVNESVKLSKKYGHAGSIRYVNGLLRKFNENRNDVTYPDEKDSIKYLSVVYSHPEWMVKKWIDKFGFEFTKNLCNANNCIPPLSTRVNTLKTDINGLKQALINENVEVEDGLYFDDAVLIKPNESISNLESFKGGLFQIQDESSMLAGEIADPLPGHIVIDVCAAPGGKSTHLAQIMKNQGKIISRDIHQHKIDLIRNNAKRLGIEIIDAGVFDASNIDPRLIDVCDRVLVDAPCSGLGIIRRKPDIKWNKQNENKSELIELQKRILKISSKYVRRNGALIYSTCTIEEDENIDVVKDFLKNNSNFYLADISKHVPDKLQKDTCRQGYIQIYPNIDNIDGFFVAKMVRR